MSSSSPEHWEALYRQRRVDEVSWFEQRPARSLACIEATGSARDAAVVDVGGGASTLVDHLLEAGFEDVTVLDVSAAALEHARRRLGDRAGGVSWVVSDVLAWRPDRAFDLWHDRAVLHFLVDPADRRRYVETMRRVLARGGHAVIATFGPQAPEQCSGLPVVRYEAETLAALFGEDFRLEAHTLGDHRTPGGATQQFLYARLRRADSRSVRS